MDRKDVIQVLMKRSSGRLRFSILLRCPWGRRPLAVVAVVAVVIVIVIRVVS